MYVVCGPIFLLVMKRLYNQVVYSIIYLPFRDDRSGFKNIPNYLANNS